MYEICEAVFARHQASKDRRFYRRPRRQQVGEFLVVPACMGGYGRQRMQHVAQCRPLAKQRVETGAGRLAHR